MPKDKSVITIEMRGTVKSYIALPWPKYKDYMTENWFREESYYDANKDTYLIPKERYDASI